MSLIPQAAIRMPTGGHHSKWTLGQQKGSPNPCAVVGSERYTVAGAHTQGKSIPYKLSGRAYEWLNQSLAHEARAYEVADTSDNLVSSVAAERNNE